MHGICETMFSYLVGILFPLWSFRDLVWIWYTNREGETPLLSSRDNPMHLAIVTHTSIKTLCLLLPVDVNQHTTGALLYPLTLLSSSLVPADVNQPIGWHRSMPNSRKKPCPSYLAAVIEARSGVPELLQSSAPCREALVECREGAAIHSIL